MIISCGEALVDMVPHAVAGGGPMNAAIAAARLGEPAAFGGALSTDQHGDMLLAHLESNGVDTRLVQRTAAPTARAIVEHVPELRFRFEGSDTADTTWDVTDFGPLDPGPHILHGGTLGMFRGTTAETLARLVASHHGLVSLDPNIRPQIIDDRAQWDHFHQRWLPHTDIYKASDEDLEWIWPDRSHDASAAALLESGVSTVVVTRGGEGLSIHTANGEATAQAPAVEVVDTVGAGDTAIAAVLASLSAHPDPATSVGLDHLEVSDWAIIAKRAVDAAAITCSRQGADPPTRDEVEW